MGAFSCFGVEVTAAGTSPFRGGFAGSTAKRLPPQRELSAARLTEDKPFCWETHDRGGKVYLPPSAAADGPPPSAEGGEGWRQSRHKLVFRVLRTRPKGFAIALWKPSPALYLKLVGAQRWQVTAALSAAVTTTQQQETARNFQAEPSSQKRTRQTPVALREGARGGERQP